MRLMMAVVFAAGLAAAGSPRQASWGELGFVVGRHVRIAMPDGAVVGGKVLAVEPEALVVQGAGKEAFRAPRKALKAFEMSAKTKRYRVIATALGSATGLMVGCVAAITVQGGIFGNSHNGAASATAVGIWSAGTLGGYFLGNAADRKTVTVVVRD
jgi:hypothetical protein